MPNPDPDDHEDADADDPRPGAQSRPLTRRESLALLGATASLGLLAGCEEFSDGDAASTTERTRSEPATTSKRQATPTERSSPTEHSAPTERSSTPDNQSSAREWEGGVDAAGHGLSNLGSLGFEAGHEPVRTLTGDHLTVEDGSLSVDAGSVSGLPESYHVVSEYPGDTLDQKLTAAIDRAAETATKSGHRFVVPPPDPDDPAADGGPAWRFEEPVVIDSDRGGYFFEFGRTRVHATSEMDSLFVVGPDEKTEGISFDGGLYGAGGNLRESFVDIRGVGHMWINQMYLAGGVDYGRNSVPAGIRLADEHGTSELTVTDTEVTGCTDGFLATQTADVPYGAAFDLDIYNFRAGGGETSVRIDGGVGVNLHSVQAGGHPVQSVSDSIVRFENSRSAVRKADVSFVRERHNSTDFHSGVRVVDVTGGTGQRHDGVSVRNVDVHHAEYGTDLNYVTHFDQQHVRPPPAAVETASAGTSRWFERTQVFDSTRGHEFRVDGTPRLSVVEGGVRFPGEGAGPVLETPDGSAQYRVRLDNDGNLVTEPVGSGTTSFVDPPPAATVTPVDSFEDGDLAEYSGSTGSYEVTADAPVGDGTYSLKARSTGTGPLVSTGGLGSYPSAGDTIAAKVAQTDAHPFVGVAWGVQDTENFYWTRVDTTEDTLDLYRMADGEPTLLGSTRYRLDDVGTVYEFVVDWAADGGMTAELYSPDDGLESRVFGTDTTFEDGGVGLRQGGMLDHVRFW